MVNGEMQNQCKISENIRKYHEKYSKNYHLKYHNRIPFKIIVGFAYYSVLKRFKKNMILGSPNGGWCLKGSTPCRQIDRWRLRAVKRQDEKKGILVSSTKPLYLLSESVRVCPLTTKNKQAESKITAPNDLSCDPLPRNHDFRKF